MPNHFHCIIEIPDIPVVGMALCGHPSFDGKQRSHQIPGINETPKTHEIPDDIKILKNKICIGQDAHAGASLPRVTAFKIMDWFKTMTTNEYIRGVKIWNWPRFEKRFWQLRYWDHIIRNEIEFKNIQEYIKNNPSNWHNDTFRNPDGRMVTENSGRYGKEIWMV
jgi:hypothetical protein